MRTSTIKQTIGYLQRNLISLPEILILLHACSILKLIYLNVEKGVRFHIIEKELYKYIKVNNNKIVVFIRSTKCEKYNNNLLL